MRPARHPQTYLSRQLYHTATRPAIKYKARMSHFLRA